MSTVFKCDRCGKLFDPLKKKKKEEWLGIHKDHRLYPAMSLDLCTCCEKSLMEWFYKGAERDGR